MQTALRTLTALAILCLPLLHCSNADPTMPEMHDAATDAEPINTDAGATSDAAPMSDASTVDAGDGAMCKASGTSCTTPDECCSKECHVHSGTAKECH